MTVAVVPSWNALMCWWTDRQKIMIFAIPIQLAIYNYTAIILAVTERTERSIDALGVNRNR